jgi:hypothetical protein
MAITYHAGRRIQGLALTESDTTLDSTAGNNAWNTVYSSNGSTMTHYGGEHFTATKWRNLELKTFVIKYGKSSASSTGSHYLKVYGSDHTTQIGSTITGTPNVSSTATEGAGGTDVTFDLTGITSPNTEWFIGCGTSATGSAPTNIRINTSSAGDGSNYWREYNGYNDYTSQSASFTLVYVGVSGDVKPTNVQVGSRFEETDTRKIYHYESGLKYEDDFSDDNWTDNDSTYIGVSGGSMNWNAKRDGSNDASVYDLTSTSANWVLRFKLTVTNVSSSTQAGNGFYVGLSDSIQTAGQSTSQDFIGVSIYNDNTDTYRTIDADGSALPAVYSGDSSQVTTYSTGSVWYYEIIKTGSSYTVEAFSGSDYSTGSEGKITGS